MSKQVLLNKKRNSFESFLKYETFLSKLYDILNTENVVYSKIIRWNKQGDGVIISDANKLSKVILPKFYKHHNYSSFVRQLNMYGFRKTKESTGLNINEQEYTHEKFNRKCTKDQIKTISRRKGTQKSLITEEIYEEFQKQMNDNNQSNSSNISDSNGNFCFNEGQKNVLNYLIEQINGNYLRQKKLEEQVIELKEQNIILNNKLETFQNRLVVKNKNEFKIKKFFKLLIEIISRKLNKNNFNRTNNNNTNTKNSINSLEIISNNNDGVNLELIPKKCNFIDFIYKYLNHRGIRVQTLNNNNNNQEINKNIKKLPEIIDNVSVILSQNSVKRTESFSIFTQAQSKSKIKNENVDSDSLIFDQNNKDELSLFGFQLGQTPSSGVLFENDSSYSLSCNLFKCNH